MEAPVAPRADDPRAFQAESRPRILLALESAGPGGAERMVLLLARALAERGFVPHLATLRTGWLTEAAEDAGIPVWVCPQRPGLDPLWPLRFARRLRREGIDLVHSHEFVMNVYAGAAARLARVPSLATLHGRQWFADRRVRILAYRALLRGGMGITAVSEDLAGFAAERLRLPPGLPHRIPNGIPVPGFTSPGEDEAQRVIARRELGFSESAPLLVAIGNLYPVKDHACLLRAFARLGARTPAAQLAIAGRGGEQAALEALAVELGIADRVQLLGARQDVPKILTAADLFVLSSRSEGLPLSVLEAMAAARPVVATRVGGVPEAVVDGETGVLVPAGDPTALARAMGELLGDPARCRAYGRAGHARAEQEFSDVAMASRYAALYAERLGSAAPPAA